MNPIAVSTWSLHRTLGYSFANGPGVGEPFVKSNTWGEGLLPFEALPSALASHGFGRCEICHFHLGSQAPDYLAEIGALFHRHGVVIQTLLIDDGDITNPATAARDMAWIGGWIESAAHLGAENARVIAGKQKPDATTLADSIEGLKQLAALGHKHGVRVVTENWFDLLATPAEVMHVLEGVGPELGFLADTGNWSGRTKYSDLQMIFARAELCHSKTGFSAGLRIDADDYAACIRAGMAAGYGGPHTLIFDSDGDEWDGLAVERDFLAKIQQG